MYRTVRHFGNPGIPLYCDYPIVKKVNGVIVPLREVVSTQSIVNHCPVYTPHVNRVDVIENPR